MELPGWNSIQTTGALANTFFWVSMGALVLLALAQVISYGYGQRHNLLASQQNGAEKRASDEKIIRLHHQTATLTANIESSKLATAGANARAEQAQEALVGANVRAEEAQLALQQLKAPRIISEDAARAIKVALKPFGGQQWTMTTFWDLKEPLDFATTLYEPLNSAGWKYDDSGSRSLLPDGLTGVQVLVHPQADMKVKAAAMALVAALNKHNFSAALKLVNSADIDKVQINVGIKTDPSSLGIPAN